MLNKKTTRKHRFHPVLKNLLIFTAASFYISDSESPETLSLLQGIAILFLIGAIARLFSRLYNQSKTDTSIDDYKLSFARLIATPLYSGLAALGGVFLAQKIGLSASSISFELTTPNILIAATFGLTPILFMNAIQREADQYKKDLKSTEAQKAEIYPIPGESKNNA